MHVQGCGMTLNWNWSNSI